ncbi:hypothetical protein LCGC14_1669530 [marine sediment metagenome]|uniref:Uncharacterized protein n=1 Tax=marine sediment metagenome TaxID=412755 RepID=A0A0F9HRQ2_9ZZZZ
MPMIDDIFVKRVFEKLDKLDEAVRGEDGLCNRMTRIETQLGNHLETQKRKFDKTTIVIGIIIGIIALVVAFK